MDALPRLPSAIRIRVHTEMRTPIETEALLLAKKGKLDFGNELTPESIEWVHWFLRTEARLKEYEPDVFERAKLLDVYEYVRDVPRKYDEAEFPNLVRASLILDTVEHLTKWPEIYECLVHLREWSKTADEVTKNELFDMSTIEMERIRELTDWPVPQSIKWLTGLSLLALSLFPYGLSFLSTLLTNGIG